MKIPELKTRDQLTDLQIKDLQVQCYNWRLRWEKAQKELEQLTTEYRSAQDQLHQIKEILKTNKPEWFQSDEDFYGNSDSDSEE